MELIQGCRCSTKEDLETESRGDGRVKNEGEYLNEKVSNARGLMHPELGDLQSRIARQHITEPGIWFTSWGCSLRHLWSGSGYRRNR